MAGFARKIITSQKSNPAYTEQLRATRAYQAALYGEAQNLAAGIRETAPVATGAYRKSIKAIRTGAIINVGTTDSAGHIIEWGSVQQPAQAPIRRGLRAMGARFTETP